MARIAEPVHNFEAQERDFAHVAELLGIGMCYFPWFEATMKEQVGQSLLAHIGKLSSYNFPYLLTATMTVCPPTPSSSGLNRHASLCPTAPSSPIYTNPPHA